MNTMSTSTTYLSKKGMKELKKAITRLEHRRDSVIKQLRESEKGETHDQRLERVERLAQLEIIESELADKREILRTAKLLPRKRDALKVALGSVVDLIDMTGQQVRYTIVDSIEANPSDGRISINSPLGQTLLGRTIKDTIEWGNGIRSRQMQLIGIS